ncbi:MAG: hypothetical protein ACF8XB_03075 [Planctomycetota bacterium JB042]
MPAEGVCHPLLVALFALSVPSRDPPLDPGAYVVAWAAGDDRPDRIVLLDGSDRVFRAWPVEIRPRVTGSPAPATLERSADGERERLRFVFEVGAGAEALPFELGLTVPGDALRTR